MEAASTQKGAFSAGWAGVVSEATIFHINSGVRRKGARRRVVGRKGNYGCSAQFPQTFPNIPWTGTKLLTGTFMGFRSSKLGYIHKFIHFYIIAYVLKR